MLIQTSPQWAISCTPYINNLSAIIEKVNPDLFMEVDSFSSNLLHPKYLRCRNPLYRVLSPEHAKGSNDLILRFLFFLQERCNLICGQKTISLPFVHTSP